MGDATIGKGKVVRLRYVMRGPGGEVLDETSSDGEAYLHGVGAIVPGLEHALEGRSPGDTFSVRLAPADAFGPRRKGPAPQPVPRATFPSDAALSIGMSFTAETPSGQPVKLYISKLERNTVYVDQVHPYAGWTIDYDVEVVSIREASPKELREGGPLEP